MVDGELFIELHPDGVHDGYSIECTTHDNCVRDCKFGKRRPMSPAERRRRLLMWKYDLKDNWIDVKEHEKRGKTPLLANYAKSLLRG